MAIQSEREPRQIMGMDPVTLPSGGEAFPVGNDLTVTYEPDYDLNFETFRPHEAHAATVAIVGMKIGPISVMAGPGMFPLEAFKGDSGLRLALAVPITQKNPLKVTYRNMTASPIVGFYCGVVGTVHRAF
jgi:hypothetical protein